MEVQPTIVGDTIEAKLACVEAYLRSFQRRLQKVVTVVVPPIPIFYSRNEPDLDGTLFKCISPIKGKITGIALFVGNYQYKTTTFRIEIVSNMVRTEFTHVCDKQVETMPVNYSVAMGDLVRIYVNDPLEVSNVMIGILLEPDIATSRKEHFVFEDLITKQEEYTKEQLLDKARQIVEEKKP